MKHFILLLSTLFILTGCNDTPISNDKIDLEFLTPEPVTIVEQVEVLMPCDFETELVGRLTNGWVERIDSNTVKLNHYVNGDLMEENYATVTDFNGTPATSNPLTLPVSDGTPITHVLVVEFTQVR